MNLADLFTATSLTAAINKLPMQYGKLGAMGIFAEKGIPTTFATIEVKDGRLVLVKNTDRSAEGTQLKNGKRSRRTFECAHLPLTGQLLPGELQNITAFGGDGTPQLASQAQVINDRLLELKTSIEVTREWHRLGAIKGKILDADGSVIYDLYDEFDITEKSIEIPFTTATTDVRKFCLDAKRHAEPKLGGAIVTGFKALCDKDFFDAFTSHKTVQAAYANYQGAQDRLGGDQRSGFVYGGIEFIEYEATISGQKFIPAATARVFPVGTGVFGMYNAPANYNEAVNTIGLPYYAKSEPRKMGKGWDMEVQANPLAMCHYPEALVELVAG